MFTATLNDRVRVKLTAEGRRHHRKFHDDNHTASGVTYREPQTDSVGYSTFQLWELMQIFGSRMGIGKSSIFETAHIRFEGF